MNKYINISLISNCMLTSETYLEFLNELLGLKSLLEKGHHNECMNKVNALMNCDVNCPDLWIMKAMLMRSDEKMYNFCLMKARSLVRQNVKLIIFTDSELNCLKLEKHDLKTIIA